MLDMYARARLFDNNLCSPSDRPLMNSIDVQRQHRCRRPQQPVPAVSRRPRSVLRRCSYGAATSAAPSGRSSPRTR